MRFSIFVLASILVTKLKHCKFIQSLTTATTVQSPWVIAEVPRTDGDESLLEETDNWDNNTDTEDVELDEDDESGNGEMKW